MEEEPARVPPGSVAVPFHVEALLPTPFVGAGPGGADVTGPAEGAEVEPPPDVAPLEEEEEELDEPRAALVREMPIRWLGSWVSRRCTWLKSPSVLLMRREISSS